MTIVFREGDTVEQTWKRLHVFIRVGASRDELDDGWFTPEEIEGGRYKLVVDGSDEEIVVRQFDIEAHKGRQITRSTFEKYVRRARESHSRAD